MNMVEDKPKEVCQQIEGTKGPFKGKGPDVAQWRREALEKLEQIYAEMRELRDETKTFEERTFSVDLYYLSNRNSKNLRWRLRNGDHSTWERVKPLMANLPPSLVWWYHEVQLRMIFLNNREKAARYQLNLAKLAEEAAVEMKTPRV